MNVFSFFFCVFAVPLTLFTCIFVSIEEKQAATNSHKKTVCDDAESMALSDIKIPFEFHPNGNLEFLWNSNKIKAFKSKIMQQNWALLSSLQVTGINDSLMGVVETFQASGCNVYFFGGGIRDSIIGKVGADIDGSASCSSEEIKNICVKKYGIANCFLPKPKSTITRIGSMKTDNSEKKNEIISIDLSSFSSTFETSKFSWEYSINYVVYDPKNDILFDMTGQSLGDQCNRIFDIPVPQNQWKNWAYRGGLVKALRFWSLKKKGFEPASSALLDFIIQTIDQKFSRKKVQRFFCLKFLSGYSLNGVCHIRYNYSNHANVINADFHEWSKQLNEYQRLYHMLKSAFYFIEIRQR